MKENGLKSFELEWAKIKFKYESPKLSYELKEIAEGDNYFVIFGVGKIAHYLAEKFNELNILNRLKAFCNMYSRGYDKDYSVPIITPIDLLKAEYTHSVIIVATEPVFYPAYYDEILYLCNGLGFDRERVFKCVDGFVLDNFVFGSTHDFEYNFYDGYKLAYNTAPDVATKQIILNRIRDYCSCGKDKEKANEVLRNVQYASCRYIENGYVRFGGNLGEEICKFCCARLKNGNRVPAFYISENPATTLDTLNEARKKIRAENIAASLLNDDSLRKLSKACPNCNMFIRSGWRRMKNDLITNVTYEIYPAPCQGKCIYCDVHCTERGRYNSAEHLEQSLNVLRTIEYGNTNGYYSEFATYHIITGEIAIHPLKDEILRVVKGRYTQFGTNAFIYDEKIGCMDDFGLYYSIDAGTENTWRAVKGVNNFRTVIENLKKYKTMARRGDKINLKYVIIPGYNNHIDDYFGVIDIMNDLGINAMLISCAYRYTDTPNEIDEELFKAAGILYRLLICNNKISVINSISFSPDEARRIVSYARDYDIQATIPK